MAALTSDEDKYADESFETDSDVSSNCEKADDFSDPELYQPPQTHMTNIRNNALLTSTQARQMKLHGIMGAYPLNRDALPFDSSSDDEDDVVYSETVAKVNSDSRISDNFQTQNRDKSCSTSDSEQRQNMHQLIETTESEIDLSLPTLGRCRPMQLLSHEESNFVSDVSEELEKEMEMQINHNQAHLTKHIESSSYSASHMSMSGSDLRSEPTSPKSEKSADSCASMQELANKIQHELHIAQSTEDANIEAVVKIVTEAMSKFTTEQPTNDQLQQKQQQQQSKKQQHNQKQFSNQSRIKPPFRLPGEIKRTLPHRNSSISSMENTTASSDVTLTGSKSYTIIPSQTHFKNAAYQEEQQQQQYLRKHHHYIKEESPEIEDNIDSPKSQKSSIHSYKMQDMGTMVETENTGGTETAVETDVDLRFYEPKVQMRPNHNNSPNSYRSDLSLRHSKPSRNSSSVKLSGSKQGQSMRKSWSFSNERMRQIERENRILLEKILTQKPTIPTTKKKTTKYNYLPPTTFTTKASIERKKLQRQIDLDNHVLKNKIESVSFRRRPMSFQAGAL